MLTPLTKRLLALAAWLPFGLYAGYTLSFAAGTAAPPAAIPLGAAPARDAAAGIKTAAARDAAMKDVASAAAFRQADTTGTPFTKALTDRHWAVANAGKFADAKKDKPPFGGPNAGDFAELVKAKDDRAALERQIDVWFEKAVPGAAADAKDHLKDLLDMVVEYQRGAGRGAGAVRELRGRHRVVVADGRRLTGEYDAALRADLPIVGAAGLVREMDGLTKSIDEFQSVYATQPAAQFRDMAIEITALAEQWAARKKLLGLFKDDPETLTPPRGGDRLKEINGLYARIKESSTRGIIREKVQQFCGKFLPPKLALDDEILVSGSPVKRALLEARYAAQSGADPVDRELQADPDGLNEFTAATKARAGETFNGYWVKTGRTAADTSIKPTEKSKAAVAYTKARRKVAAWTPDAVAGFMRAAGDPDDAKAAANWNAPARLGGGDEFRAWDRLRTLADAMTAHKELFPEN